MPDTNSTPPSSSNPPPVAPTIIKSPYTDPPFFPEINAHHLFFDRPDQASWTDYTYLIDAETGKKTMYKEFVEWVRDVATALGTDADKGGLGLSGDPAKREMVGILSENSVEYMVLIQALLAVATPFALFSSYATAFELRHYLNLSKITHLFTDAKFLPLAVKIAKEVGLPSKRIYVLQGRAHDYGQGHRKTLSDVRQSAMKGKMERLGARPVKRDTLAYLVFSSGTSGLPKAVMISHGNIIYSVLQAGVVGQAVAEVYTPPTPPTPEGIPISLAFLPLYHTYGLHAYTFRSLLQPSTLVLVKRWEIRSALRHIAKYRVTILLLVPSVLHQLVNYPDIKKADLSSILAVSSGAAYLPQDLTEKISSLIPQTARLGDGFGMSEVTISAIQLPFSGVLNGKAPRIPGSTGVLLPGLEARIVDDATGQDLGPTNRPGELWLRGANVALGYWENEKANKETFIKDGWLRTGDRFRANADGVFFFEDRAKDTLKISGIQVSPVEIENVLMAHPEKLLTDCSVAGVSGGRTSDEKVPRAWIVLSAEGKKLGVKETIARLDEWHKGNLSKHKWLRGGYEVVKEIPKSVTGKVLRRVLQDEYEKKASRKSKSKSKL